jgi:Transcriptional regulator, AbiEi antitoxin
MPHQWSLEQVLARQDGVIARSQLITAGIDDRAISRRVRDGEWQRILHGVYRVASEALTLERRRIAAALYAGQDAQLTGAATLLWYGFKAPLATDRVHALVPHSVHRRSTGFVMIQRTLSMDPGARDVGLYWITSPARAVVDACRTAPDLRVVRSIMAEAVQRNFVSLRTLDDEIRRAARSRTALVRRVMSEILTGVRSSPEAELRDITARSTVLPAILWNPYLVGPNGTRLPTPDGWLAEAAMALEVDSQEHHAVGDDWRNTLRRSNILAELGAVVLHFTPAEIRTEPMRVLRVIEQTFLARIETASVTPIAVLERSPS